jgi:hypothetical protein
MHGPCQGPVVSQTPTEPCIGIAAIAGSTFGFFQIGEHAFFVQMRPQCIDQFGPVGESADRAFDIVSTRRVSAELQAARVVALSGTRRSLESAACALDVPAS